MINEFFNYLQYDIERSDIMEQYIEKDKLIESILFKIELFNKHKEHMTKERIDTLENYILGILEFLLDNRIITEYYYLELVDRI